MRQGLPKGPERAEQKAVLRAQYPDYDAKRHDLYVARWNQERDAESLANYEKARGLR